MLSIFFKPKETRFATRSPAWREIRKTHLKKQNCCKACGRNDELEVHHIVPVHINRDLELDLSNLITLCEKCHFIFGHLCNFKSWNVDVVKDCDDFYKKVTKRPYIDTFEI